MHQFWNTITKIKDTDAYNFKLDKKNVELILKSFVKFFRYVPEFLTNTLLHHFQKKSWLHSFRNLAILTQELRAQILWGMYNKKNVDYVALLWEDFIYQAHNREISSARKEHIPYPRFTKVIINHFISKDKTIFMRNKINLYTIRDDSLLDIKDSNAYKTYYDFATGKVPHRKARKYKKVALPSRKLSHVKEAELVKKTKRVKRHAKKSTTAPTTGVAIRDTPGVFVSKKKAPAKADRNEAMGTKLGVLDVPTYDSESKNESWGDSEDNNDDDSNDNSKGDDDKAVSDNDDNSNADDNERTDSDDDDENPSFTLKDYDEENKMKRAEQEKERKGDEQMTDPDQNVSQENSYEQVVEDAHVTLTSSQKTESSKQSSYFSSDFASKFLILENVSPAINEVASMMNVKLHQEESSTQAPSLFTIPETAISDTATAHTTTVPPTISMITPLL
ncbi:hypothetical protein Tco_0845534 [Tanacetum coccineum]